MWHVTHCSLSSPWEMEAETQNYLVKAVVGLLQEAVPFGSGKSRDQEEAHRRTLQVKVILSIYSSFFLRIYPISPLISIIVIVIL